MLSLVVRFNNHVRGRITRSEATELNGLRYSLQKRGLSRATDRAIEQSSGKELRSWSCDLGWLTGLRRGVCPVGVCASEWRISPGHRHADERGRGMESGGIAMRRKRKTEYHLKANGRSKSKLINPGKKNQGPAKLVCYGWFEGNEANI
jgi:hypothetical protein